MLDNLFFITAKTYAYFYFYIKKFTGLRIRGLGFLLRRISKPKIIRYKNKKLYLNPKVISSYGVNIINKYQEKETVLFLDLVMKSLNSSHEKVNFIDVGSNIGIFLLQMSSYENINRVVGFDPAIGCVEAAIKTLELNEFNRFKIYNNLVGSSNEEKLYSNDIDPQGASVYKTKDNKKSKLVKQIRLDDNKSIKELSENIQTIVLIDVEGYEPEVIKGGIQMIQKNKPLLIFEYNIVSKKHYSVDIINSLLGDNWIIFRLRKDGLLDNKVENAWNCIAIDKNSIYPNLFRILNLYS